jgi:hypothetical protein
MYGSFKASPRRVLKVDVLQRLVKKIDFAVLFNIHACGNYLGQDVDIRGASIQARK